MHTLYKWTENEALSNAYDLRAILHFLNKNKNKCILDYGCGNGCIGNYLLRLGYQVFGVDASEDGIIVANKGLREKHFYNFDFDDAILPIDLQRRTFDTVVSTQVIEHVYSPEQYIRNIAKILPVGGELYITTPYHGYLKNLALALSGKLDKHFTVLWEGGHIKFFSKKTLTILLERNNFRVVHFRGMERIPFLWKSMLIVAQKI